VNDAVRRLLHQIFQRATGRDVRIVIERKDRRRRGKMIVEAA